MILQRTRPPPLLTVNQTASLSLNDILHGLPSFQIAAVNQCSGNSRGLFQPRVSGGQWANGAMGSNYAAPVAPEDVGTIVDYLTALKGRNKSE
jgi:hypothetical protein